LAFFRSKKLKLNLNTVVSISCSLGEGLYLTGATAGWVDINTNRLLFGHSSEIAEFHIKSKPSVILEVCGNSVILGCDVGVVLFDTVTHREKILRNIFGRHDLALYRSNDGGSYGDYELLSFMHRHNPAENSGYVYHISGDSWSLLDDSIGIPNTFIEIQPSKILISDSLDGAIWLFELDSIGRVKNKRLWTKIEDGGSPDGGCLVGDLVLIALWDAAAIAVFSKNGELIDRVSIPVIRPTNCKYDAKNAQLWVTSASEGLSESQLSEYPASGNTFVFDLEFL